MQVAYAQEDQAPVIDSIEPHSTESDDDPRQCCHARTRSDPSAVKCAGCPATRTFPTVRCDGSEAATGDPARDGGSCHGRIPRAEAADRRSPCFMVAGIVIGPTL